LTPNGGRNKEKRICNRARAIQSAALRQWRIASLARTYKLFSADSHFESARIGGFIVFEAIPESSPRRLKLPNGKDIIVEEGGITFREPISSPASLWKSSARSD
jgi:hypothetical protein